MSKKISDYIKPILKDRVIMISMLLVFLIGISFFVYVLVQVKQIDQLIYSRYTSYGLEHYYRDKWFYRALISIFGLVVAFLHNFIIIKLYNVLNRTPAFIFAFFSIVVTIIAFVIIGSSIQIPN